MQPLAAGGTHSPIASIPVVQEVDRQDRMAGLGGCGQRGIVREAQVLAEPDNDRVLSFLGQGINDEQRPRIDFYRKAPSV